MLHTPRDITCLPLLFVFSQNMLCVVNHPEFRMKLLDKLFGLLLGVCLVFLHGQKDQIPFLGIAMIS